MKTRLLIALIACITSLGILASVAQADDQYTNSCGGSGVAGLPGWGAKGGGYVNPVYHWQQNCGLNKTIAVELQHNTTDHPKTWVDAGCFSGCSDQDYQFSTPSGMENQWVSRTFGNTWPTACGTSQGWQFRIHVWWSGGDDAGNPVSAPGGCG